jgi:hypothetical protein
MGLFRDIGLGIYFIFAGIGLFGLLWKLLAVVVGIANFFTTGCR